MEKLFIEILGGMTFGFIFVVSSILFLSYESSKNLDNSREGS